MQTITHTHQPQAEYALQQSIAELGYAMAYSQNPFNEDESEVYLRPVRQLLSPEIAQSTQEYYIIVENIYQDLEASYQYVLKKIREHRSALTRTNIRKFLYVLEYLADLAGIEEENRQLINRFEKDLHNIYYLKKGVNPSLKMSTEHQALYSTVGQLAYIITMADRRTMPNEKKAFQKIIQENFGVFDKLIEERFQVLQDIGEGDLESTYEHSLYLIRKNKKALDEEIIQNCLSVMTQLAEVAGITPEEKKFIERFKKDVYEIYQEK